MIDAELLLLKYREGKCTPEEIELLHTWFHNLNLADETILDVADLEEASANIKSNIRVLSKKPFTWSKWIAAAVVIAICSVGYLLILRNKSNQDVQILAKDAVILQLEDGRQINLKNVADGVLEEISGLRISKTANGRLQYNFNTIDSSVLSKIEYHTLKTPIGEVFEIILDDGTSVVLNTKSTLRFPSSFRATKSRDVELIGEAYFNVAKSAKDQEGKPFTVRSKDQIVEVLGTGFNISAYPNESLFKTTLSHGVVRVRLADASEVIQLERAGDQAVYKDNTLNKRNVSLENELAWKNGKLVFQDQNIYSIMRVIARYYPIEVQYKDDFRGDLFGGIISKGRSLEEMLRLVEETGEVKFEISSDTNTNKERRVIVMK